MHTPDVGRQISAAMQRAHLTQRALAAAIGSTQGAVSHWTTGRRRPDAITLRQIAAACGCAYIPGLPGQLDVVVEEDDIAFGLDRNG
jgi:transcriptional regulator with XRE-family HTH domain